MPNGIPPPFADILLWSTKFRLKSTSSGFAAIWCIKCSHTDVLWMCGLTFIWKIIIPSCLCGGFLYLTHRTQAWQKICCKAHIKTAISSSGRADDNQDCCMVRGSRPRWRSNFSKLFWIRSPYYHPCKVEHCHCLAIQDGSDQWKAHTGESRLKWEAKDSSKLIGNKDHALRGLSSPMVGIRQIRLIT